MVRLLADEHIPARLVDALRLLGYSITTVRQISRNKSGDGIPDETVLDYAIQRRWAVLTFNEKDFRKLHKTHAWHFGIIVAEPESDTKAQARRIDAVIKQAGSLQGQLLLVSLPRGRHTRKRRS